MAEAELIITPDVARAELNRAVNQLEKALEQAAKNAGRDFEKEIAKGVKDGAQDGMGGLGGGVRRGGLSANMIDGMKKAGGILGGAAVLALGVGVNEIMSRVDIATALIQQQTGESTAPETIALARDLGLSGAEYQSIREAFAVAGIREDADVLETLREITVQTEEAERGEGDLLEDFKGQRGAELFRNVFASLGNVSDPAKRVAILAQLNEEAVGALSKVIDAEFKAAGGGLGAGVSAADMFGVTEKHQRRAEAFQNEATKVEEFRQRQYDQTQLENERFWKEFDAKAANAYFARQEHVSQQQTALIGELSKNVQAANTIDSAIKAAMNPLASGVNTMVDQLSEIARLLRGDEGQTKAEADAKANADMNNTGRVKPHEPKY